jgi:hypothetical protein
MDLKSPLRLALEAKILADESSKELGIVPSADGAVLVVCIRVPCTWAVLLQPAKVNAATNNIERFIYYNCADNYAPAIHSTL